MKRKSDRNPERAKIARPAVDGASSVGLGRAPLFAIIPIAAVKGDHMLDAPARRGSERARGAFISDATAVRRAIAASMLRRGGLAGRILLVTSAAIFLSMTLAFLIRLESARENWLRIEIAIVEATLDAFDPDHGPLPPELADKLLSSLKVRSIAVLGPGPGERRDDRIEGSTPEPRRTLARREPAHLLSNELYRFHFSRAVRDHPGAKPGSPLEVVFVEKPLTEALRRAATICSRFWPRLPSSSRSSSGPCCGRWSCGPFAG